MSEWSVAVTSFVGVDGTDLDDGVARLVEVLSEHAAVGSYSPGKVGVRIALTADRAEDAAQSGLRLVVTALESLGWQPDVRDVQATEWSLFEAELEEPNFPELVGVTEIAELLGTSRQRASELARSAKFPVPVAELAAGPVWPKSRIARFVEEWERKPGRPRARSA